MKRKAFFSIVSLLLIICLISCSNSGSGSSSKKAHVSARVGGKEVQIPVEVNKIEDEIGDDSFLDATKFDGDIALISLVMASNTGKEKKIREVYSELEMDNVVCNDNYDTNTADSISYCIGHFNAAGYDLIAVTVRGDNYDLPLHLS